MRRWAKLRASGEGSRSENEDFALSGSYAYGKRRVTVLLACDGVGSESGGRMAAEAIGTAALGTIRQYLEERARTSRLDREDCDLLQLRLSRLHPEALVERGSTTLAIAIIDYFPRHEPPSLIWFWAGDSRVYLLSGEGTLEQLSRDHHDQEGRITSFYKSDGILCGNLGSGHLCIDTFYAVMVTTDGVHGSAELGELRHFLWFCIDRRVGTDRQLKTYLSAFLGKNISDNYSIALQFRSVSRERLLSLASDFLE